MLQHISGRDLTLVLEFKIGGEFVMPDAGSIALTIRDALGVPLAAYDSTPLPDVSINTISVLIPGSENLLNPAKSFEPRFVELSFLSNGKPGSVKTFYQLINFVPIQVSPENVRQVLGISEGELPDLAVDLFQSFLKLNKSPSFSTALVSGNLSGVYANQVLLYTEALRLAPSLQARILKQEEKDNALYTRFTVNFEALKQDLLDALEDAQNSLDEELGEGNGSTAVLLVVTTPTDPVTNT